MKRLGLIFGTIAMCGALLLSAAQSARADGAASTRNVILGAAALIAGAAIETNVAQKQRLANTVVGYTSYGAAVYADNHVVLPSGESYYPNNVGQTIACNNGACTISGGYNTGYDPSAPYNGGYYYGAPSNGGYYNGP
ncbi:MAG: hypothetical protein JO043_02125 [Candidatus Eremiobacteraeota bacterium]|nr:hypothetical protein [Candidatus Eremiobacteraeota bacterium]